MAVVTVSSMVEDRHGTCHMSIFERCATPRASSACPRPGGKILMRTDSEAVPLDNIEARAETRYAS